MISGIFRFGFIVCQCIKNFSSSNRIGLKGILITRVEHIHLA